jgi:hypothetical protein
MTVRPPQMSEIYFFYDIRSNYRPKNTGMVFLLFENHPLTLGQNSLHAIMRTPERQNGL